MRGAGEVVVEGGVVVAVVVLVVVAAVGSRRTKRKKSLVGSGSFRGSQPRWETSTVGVVTLVRAWKQQEGLAISECHFALALQPPLRCEALRGRSFLRG